MERPAPTGLVIRPQEERDAAVVVALHRESDDAEVLSEQGWLHRRHRTTPRSRRLGLVAELDGRIVGLGQASLDISTTTPGATWATVKVAAEARRQGIGSALYRQLLVHLREIGGSRVTTFARHTNECERWAAARGWQRLLTLPLIALDPKDVPEPEPPAGFACVPAGAVEQLQGVFELTRLAIIDEPGPVPSDDLRYDDWLAEWQDPDLDLDASAIVVQDARPVAFSYLKIAGETGQHVGTATLPELRGRGLATAAKRHALRTAARKGVTRVTTSNAEESTAMRAINHALGFQPIGAHVILGRDLDGC